jgi:hypothetical protein
VSFDPEMGFYSGEADIATFIPDMDMLNAFFVDEG